MKGIWNVQRGHCPSPGSFTPFLHVSRTLVERMPELGPTERSAALGAINVCLCVASSKDRKRVREILTGLFCDGNPEQQKQLLPSLGLVMRWDKDYGWADEIAGSVGKLILFENPADVVRDSEILTALFGIEAHVEKAKRNTVLISQNVKRLEGLIRDGKLEPLVLKQVLESFDMQALEDEDVLLMAQAISGKRVGGPGSLDQRHMVEKLAKHPPTKGAIQVCMLLSSDDAELGSQARKAYVSWTGDDGLRDMDAFYLEMLRREKLPREYYPREHFYWYWARAYFAAETKRDLKGLLSRLRERKPGIPADRLRFLRDPGPNMGLSPEVVDALGEQRESDKDRAQEKPKHEPGADGK